MNRRIETRVVQYAVEGVGAQINREATEVWWITCSPATMNTISQIQIFDGFDGGGKLKWELHPGYARNYNFVPPIHCEQGVYILIDQNILCYTIAYRPKKWDRPKPMKADVIEHPEA